MDQVIQFLCSDLIPRFKIIQTIPTPRVFKGYLRRCDMAVGGVWAHVNTRYVGV